MMRNILNQELVDGDLGIMIQKIYYTQRASDKMNFNSISFVDSFTSHVLFPRMEGLRKREI